MMVNYKVTKRISQPVIDKILEISNTKKLTAYEIIEEAKKKTSPLHDLFDWDNSSAAQKYRLHQARILVNEVKVVIDEEEYYAFENVSVCTTSDENYEEEQKEMVREYKPVTEILTNIDLRRQVIASALSHLAYWEKQNAKYQELKPIISSAEKVRKKLEKQWQKKKK